MATFLSWRGDDTHDILISSVLVQIQRAPSLAGDTVSRSAVPQAAALSVSAAIAAAEIMIFVCAAFFFSVTAVKASAP
jgi:hypothetical protein